MRLSPKELNRLGTDLFGPNWKTALATLINVSDRTMRRYAKTGIRFEDHQIEEILEYFHQRMGTLKVRHDWLIGKKSR